MNLITNSTFQTNVAGTLYTPAVTYGSGTLTITASSLEDGLPANYLTILQATDKTGVYFDFSLKPNTPHVFSVHAKNVIGGRLFYIVSSLNGLGAVWNTLESGWLDTVTEVNRLEIPFTSPANTKGVRVDLYQANGKGGSVSLAAVQLDEGSVAKDFAISQSGKADEISEGSSGDVSFAKATITLLDKLNPTNRCAYELEENFSVGSGSSGIIPFPELVEDTSGLRAWTVLSTGDADANTPDHLEDADGDDWTDIDALLAPVFFPIYNETDGIWCVAASVAAHDITLGSDDFPDGDETYVIYKPTIKIAVTGLYLIYIHVNIPTVEKKTYDISLHRGIVTPAAIHTEHYKPTETGEQTFAFTCIESLTAGWEIYVLVTNTAVADVVIDDAEIVIVKL